MGGQGKPPRKMSLEQGKGNKGARRVKKHRRANEVYEAWGLTPWRQLLGHFQGRVDKEEHDGEGAQRKVRWGQVIHHLLCSEGLALALNLREKGELGRVTESYLRILWSLPTRYMIPMPIPIVGQGKKQRPRKWQLITKYVSRRRGRDQLYTQCCRWDNEWKLTFGLGNIKVVSDLDKNSFGGMVDTKTNGI